MLQATIKRSNQRSKPRQATPVRVANWSKAGAVLTVSYDQPVRLKGVPQYGINVDDATPASAFMPGPATVAITYTTDITTATQVTIPFEDPGIRNAVGGYVADTGFKFA